jgi:hypothetical protein
MILDNETFDKVKNLFKTPHTKIAYCGVIIKNTVCFSLEMEEQTPSGKATRSGFVAHITEDFRIHSVERLKQIWGRYKGQVITEYLPIHPEGNKTTLYKLMNKEIKEL